MHTHTGSWLQEMAPSVRAYASTRSSKPHPRAPPPDPRLKPGPVFVASGGVIIEKSQRASQCIENDFRTSIFGGRFRLSAECALLLRPVGTPARRRVLIARAHHPALQKYCPEVRSFREDLFAKLRTFQRSCCRAMCWITMALTIRHRTSPKQLQAPRHRPRGQYHYRSLLRWTGHLSRMLMSPAPRQLLTGLVAHPRPTGSPPMTFCHGFATVLVQCGQSPDFGVWCKWNGGRCLA